MKVQVELRTVTGRVILTGEADAVRNVVEADIRGRLVSVIDTYPEEDTETIARAEQCLNDHNFFRGMPYEQINLFLENDLFWADGLGNRSHEIKEL
jgi:hypothetical protein